MKILKYAAEGFCIAILTCLFIFFVGCLIEARMEERSYLEIVHEKFRELYSALVPPAKRLWLWQHGIFWWSHWFKPRGWYGEIFQEDINDRQNERSF